MRKSCLDCARKHIAQAEILLCEARMGYPLHIWYAVGHMAEAEAELLAKWPGQAAIIRQHRLLIMEDDTYKVPTLSIIRDLSREAEKEEVQGVDLPEAGSSGKSLLHGPLGYAQPRDEGISGR